LGIACFEPCESGAKDIYGRTIRNDVSQCYYVREDCSCKKIFYGYREEAMAFYQMLENEAAQERIFAREFFPELISGVRIDSIKIK
jgi:hypothetical protein